MANLNFNPSASTIVHIDFNSCFASIEQQANPLLRGKAVAVAAYTSPGGCILASSVEAKRLGVKTGLRVRDGRALCPSLIVLPPDPWKYRNVHLGLRKIVSEYTPKFTPKSIDEFVLNLKDCPCLERDINSLSNNVAQSTLSPIHEVALEIKKRIKTEIGDWLTTSIGISTNRFLAKTAASLHKPDGLDEINKDNFLNIYDRLKLTDLCGIKERSAIRLNSMGIFTVSDFYQAPLWRLRAAFHSINGYYWYLRLRGWEIDEVDFKRRSYGNSYALPKPLTSPVDLAPILAKLTEKMGFRLRSADFKAKGLHLAIIYRDGSFWHKGLSFERELFDSREIFKESYRLLLSSRCRKPVGNLAISVFSLISKKQTQLELFSDVVKKEALVKATDEINERWGGFILSPAKMMGTEKNVPDRIAFGGVKELEEFVIK